MQRELPNFAATNMHPVPGIRKYPGTLQRAAVWPLHTELQQTLRLFRQPMADFTDSVRDETKNGTYIPSRPGNGFMETLKCLHTPFASGGTLNNFNVTLELMGLRVLT